MCLLAGVELLRSTWISDQIHRNGDIPTLRESVDKFLGQDPKVSLPFLSSSDCFVEQLH